MPSPMCTRCNLHNSVQGHGLCYLCWTTVHHPTPDWRKAARRRELLRNVGRFLWLTLIVAGCFAWAFLFTR